MVEPKNTKTKTIISNGNVDDSRISALADALLSRILSLLPITDAVTASVLSKRWRFLWTSIDTLNINDAPCHSLAPKKVGFVNFINSVLFLLNPPSCIHNFHLTPYYSPATESSINKWICAALEEPTNVIREVDLLILLRSPMKLPHSLFTCKTLEYLKLDGDMVFNINNCHSVCLPNLKVLHLSDVYYSYILPGAQFVFLILRYYISMVLSAKNMVIVLASLYLAANS